MDKKQKGGEFFIWKAARFLPGIFTIALGAIAFFVSCDQPGGPSEKDTEPPAIEELTIEADDPDMLIMVFSEEISISGDPPWGFNLEGGAPDISMTARSDISWGKEYKFQLSRAAAGNEVITLSYEGEAVKDRAGNGLESIAGIAVTNMLDTIPPELTSATIQDAAKNKLVLVFNEPVRVNGDAPYGLTLSGSTGAAAVSGIDSGDGTAALTFTMNGNAAQNETITLSYAGDQIKDAAGNGLAAITTKEVTNNAGQTQVDTTPPELTSATIQDAAKNKLVLVFNELVRVNGDAPYGLTLSGSTGAAAVSGIDSGDETVTLTFTMNGNAARDEEITLSYAGDQIKDAAGNGLAAITAREVTNNVGKTPLAKVTTLALSEQGAATWTVVANAASYTVKLYKDTNTLADRVTGKTAAEAASGVDLLSKMRVGGAGSYTITVTAIGSGAYSDAAESEHSEGQRVVKLDAPEWTWWNSTSAQWKDRNDKISTINKYAVQLYKGDAAQGASSDVAVTSGTDDNDGGNPGKAFVKDYSSLMTTPGSYTFKVMAIGTGLYLDSEEKESDPQTVGQGLETAAALLWKDRTNAHWNNVANATGYTIKLFKAEISNPVATKSAADDSYFETESGMEKSYVDFAADLSLSGSGIYTFTVTAKGGGIYGDSQESSPSAQMNYLGLFSAESPFGASEINAIAYNGSGAYVAVGDGGKIAYSSDGESWTAVASGTNDPFNEWGTKPDLYGVAFGSGKFFAVGENGNIVSSQDGAAWTVVSTGKLVGPFTTLVDDVPILRGITYGDSTFVAVGARGAVISSDDGAAWTLANSAAAGGKDLYTVACDGANFVAGGAEGRLISSADKGANWTWQSDYLLDPDSKPVINHIIYAGGKFVAAGDGGYLKTGAACDTWSEKIESAFGSSGILGISYGGGKFIAVGHNGKIATSPEGSSWTAVVQTQFNNDTQVKAVVYDGTKFVLGGSSYDVDGQSIMAYSD
jgi:hypothetical protein